jgi:hypothetical protein
VEFNTRFLRLVWPEKAPAPAGPNFESGVNQQLPLFRTTVE